VQRAGRLHVQKVLLLKTLIRKFLKIAPTLWTWLLWDYSIQKFIRSKDVGIWLSYREMLESSAPWCHIFSIYHGKQMTLCEDTVILIWWLIGTLLTFILINIISIIIVLCVAFFYSNHFYHSSRHTIYQFEISLLNNLLLFYCNSVL
jgi:hypothetical protein